MISPIIKHSNNNNNNNNDNSNNNNDKVPIINISTSDKDSLSKQIHDGCRFGFFYIVGHNIEQSLIDKVLDYSNKFLSLPVDVKMRFKIKLGGDQNNLGYFNLGSTYKEDIDYKEGIYLDLESNGCDCYPTSDDEVKYGLVGFKETVEMYINKLKIQCDQIMELIASSLNVSSDYFYQHQYNSSPHFNLSLLKYPSFHNSNDNNNSQIKYGIGPHCDWGLITLLYQDDIGGLQVKSNDGNSWIDVKPIRGSFVCNVGDMLMIMTQGYYKSNCHQVLYNQSGKDRYSMPFFYDPNKDTPIRPIAGIGTASTGCDKDIELFKFNGSYNDYHLFKINHTFKIKNNK